MPTFEMSVNADEIEAWCGEKADQIEDAARPAAQAAAQVLYDGVRRNVAAIGRKTGRLADSIYQAYSKNHSSQGKATYHVSWNARKAPHGHLVEFGHTQKFKVYLGSNGKWYTNKNAPLAAPVQVAARPFVRPATALFPQAMEAARAELLKRIDR